MAYLLKRKLVAGGDATDLMIDNINDLLSVGLCLRYKADPNTRVGHDPLIVWAYRHTQPPHTNSLIALLTLAGGRLTDRFTPITQPSIGGVPAPIPVDPLSPTNTPTPVEVSVVEWLVGNGYPIASRYQNEGIQHVLPPNQLAMLLLLLDRPTKGIPHSDFIRAIGDDVTGFEADPNTVVRDEQWMLLDMALSLEYHNPKTFQKTLPIRGCGYPTLNRLLILGVDTPEYQEMIMSCVDAGIEFDSHQVAILMRYPRAFIQRVEKGYDKSIWTKVCVQKANPNISRWQRLLAQSNLTTELACSATPKELSGYSDLYHVSYTEGGKTWQLPSVLYSMVLETRLNPATFAPVPESVLTAIRFRVKVMQGFRLTSHAITRDAAWKEMNVLESLWSVDTKRINVSQAVLDGCATERGRIELEHVLGKRGIRVMLRELTPSHAAATVTWIDQFARA